LMFRTNWFTVVISSPSQHLCWHYLPIRIHEELRANIIAKRLKCSVIGIEFRRLQHIPVFRIQRDSSIRDVLRVATFILKEENMIGVGNGKILIVKTG
jgi:hypothetical protein